jgi:hypothetical protein
MRFRKLRIAFSATCLIACVLLIVLWVRSYWWADVANPVFTQRVVSMTNGKLIHTDVQSRPNRYEPDPMVTPYLPPFLTFSYNGFSTSSNRVAVPPWVLIPPIVLVSIIPWVPCRFSLRTLLITTTLVAAVLGLIMWLR